VAGFAILTKSRLMRIPVTIEAFGPGTGKNALDVAFFAFQIQVPAF
jgi:hypothetical protein